MQTENKNQQLSAEVSVSSALIEPEVAKMSQEMVKREVLTVQKLRRASLDPKKILHYLHQGNREPFLRVLADFLECQPTMEAIRAFANKSPDRWAQAVTMIARLSGYNETLEVKNDIMVNIRGKSDAALLKELGGIIDLAQIGPGLFAPSEASKVQTQDGAQKQLEMFPADENVS